MLEEEKIVSEDVESGQEATEEPAPTPVETEKHEVAEVTKDLPTQILEASNANELQKCLDVFNLNQSKKNALKAMKLEDLWDKVAAQAIERFEKRPDKVSHKELLDYMQVVATLTEKFQKGATETLNAKPAIQVNQQKNEVNVNFGSGLDQDSKEKVVDFIQEILQRAKMGQQTSDQENPEIVDTEVVSQDEDCIVSEADPASADESEDADE